MSRAYSDAMKSSTALVFKIPVFKNMPASACACPTYNGAPVRQSETTTQKPTTTQNKATTKQETTAQETTKKSPVNPIKTQDVEYSTTYPIHNEQYISMDVETTVTDVKSSFTIVNGTVKLMRDGEELSNREVINQDTVVAICNQSGKVVKEYEIILIFDINQDGIVSVADFIKIKNYMIGMEEFDEKMFLAADQNFDGVVDTADSVSYTHLTLPTKRIV